MIEQLRAKKANKIRIILLKEAPQSKNLYHQSTTKQCFSHHEQSSRFPKASKVNYTSIAYLSSILQDEHLQTEKSTVPLQDDPTTARSIDRIAAYRMSGKKSNRYLSCLLQAPGNREGSHHSKTEGIDKMFERRKIMPIDKMQQRRKNITFSLKNKRELNDEFNEFVSKKTAHSHPLEFKNVEEGEVVVFSKRQLLGNKNSKRRGTAQKQKGRKKTQNIQSIQQNIEFLSTIKKTSIETKEPGYAMAFKRLSSDFPRLSPFEWSRLNDNFYQLIND